MALGKCPFCLGEAWRVEGNLYECTLCGREFRVDKNQSNKKEVKEMGSVIASKTCECGEVYTPISNGQKRCDECRAKKKKELSAEKKERYLKEKKARQKGGNGIVIPSKPSPGVLNPPPGIISIYCMRCGFPMQIEQPGQFMKEGR